MTESRDHLSEAFAQLRGEVSGLVTAPAPARLRGRAVRQLRVRRTAAAVAAVAAVAALVLGGNALLRPIAGPPVPPADSPTATPAIPVTPSPRPAPQPVVPLDDPIADVDWHHAEITLPASEDCPVGPVQFAPYLGEGNDSPRAEAQGRRITLWQGPPWAYGDLTGDGRAEVVMDAYCIHLDELDGAGEGNGRLLVVARADDGTLTGLGYIDLSDALLRSWWVKDGRLLVEVDRLVWPDGPLPLAGLLLPELPLPGLALAYEWNGTGFAGGELAPEYPPIVPVDPAWPGPPVQPRAVAAGLACPEAGLRFWHPDSERVEPEWEGGTATVDGATYVIRSTGTGHLLDLDRTGNRLLVIAVECTAADGRRRETGLAVFERSGDGWQGISVLTTPNPALATAWWWEEDRLVVEWLPWPGAGRPSHTEAYEWNGTVLVPIEE